MSLKNAVLGLLNQRPMSGFDLLKEFDVSRSVIWPAPQNEVYRVLAGLESEGLVAVQSTGSRNARTYAITEAGTAALRAWLTAPSDYTLRYEPMLKAVFFDALAPEERRARAAEDLTFFQSQLTLIQDAQRRREAANEAHERADLRSMAIGFYAALSDWARAIAAR